MFIVIRNMNFQQMLSLRTKAGKGSVAFIIGALEYVMSPDSRMPLEVAIRLCFILTDLANTII